MVRTLLVKAGAAEYKEDIILSHTGGRTAHISEMTYAECQDVVKTLQPMAPGYKNEKDLMRRKILSIAHELNWELPGTGYVDMRRVNDWCLKYTGAKKPFNALSVQELNKAVTGIIIYYDDFLKGI